jgi:predicted dithiol-disulfide oxidoreductase (DUF899 family)
VSSYRDATTTLRDYRSRIAGLRKEMREIQAGIEPEPVEDYELQGQAGPVRLSQLFGDKGELIAIHNMGASCPYCTLWADGFNGVYPHLADRAAFVVTSPDRPEQQATFAAGRGWRFPMVSHAGTSFAADMGYRAESGGWRPGISVFRREGDGMVRVSDAALGPGDDFCPVWHMLDLLPEGPAGWQPRYSYG